MVGGSNGLPWLWCIVASGLISTASNFSPAQAHGFKVLHAFCQSGGSCPDGQQPRGGLVADSKGNLYGTTYSGGASQYYGVAFELERAQNGSYKYRVIHDFGLTPKDPSDPVGPMFFDTEGNLYGVTIFGGSIGFGTIYKLSPDKDPTKQWSAHTLYSFCPTGQIGCAAAPVGGATFSGAASGQLYDGKSALYGVTYTWDGETFGQPGDLYRFQPGNGFQVIHVFGGPQGRKDGSQPQTRRFWIAPEISSGRHPREVRK